MSTNIHLQNIRPLANVNSNINDYFIDAVGNKHDIASNELGKSSIINLLRYIIDTHTIEPSVFTVLGNESSPEHIGEIDNTTNLMSYIKQLVSEIQSLQNITNPEGYLDIKLDSILTELNSIQNDWVDDGKLITIINDIKTVMGRLPDNGELTSIAKSNDLALLDGKVEGINTLIGTPVTTNIAEDINNINTDVTLLKNELLINPTPEHYRNEDGKIRTFTFTINDEINPLPTSIVRLQRINDIIIKSIIIYNINTQNNDFDSIVVADSFNKNIFIDNTTGAFTNFNEPNKQISWIGTKLLQAPRLEFTFNCSNTVNVNFKIVVEYQCVGDGGNLQMAH